jgi:hypothetical protein
MYFDRFDICEAYLAFEWAWSSGGIDTFRLSNRRRNMSTDFQLSRMHFRHGQGFSGRASLSENGEEIYKGLLSRYNLQEEE